MKELFYGRLFFPALARHADTEVMVDGPYRATLGQHADRVLRLCHALRHELDVGPGDRFAVMALNSHHFEELYHAAFLGAGVINPLNLRLAGPELEYIVRDSGTEVIFTDAWFAQLIHDAVVAAPDSPVRRVILIGEGDQPHDVGYEDLIGPSRPVAPEEPEEDDPVVLMYTGGTTGLPKGVLLDQRAEVLNLYHAYFGIGGFDPAEVYLMQTPMFHAASVAAILGVPAVGAKTVFIPAFEPGSVMSAIESEGVTQTVMVPTMIGLTMMHEAYRPERLASLRKLTYGASPMPEATLDRLLADLPGCEITQAYGMTESSSVVSFLGAEQHHPGNPRLRSVGLPVLGVELSVQDPDGNELPAGEVGEVCVRGGQYMREYWKQPEQTEAAFRGGWYHTGDAGRLEADGYLYLVDRVKDMIVTGGENVYSVEVEGAISTHPAVAQVAVIGIPHDVWGEAVHAIVVARPGVDVTSEEIIEHARLAIAGYKVPKSVELRSEPLPLSGAMKVLKKDLRAPYWEGRERAIN
jgi:long-chain acyl-CoA synthetase